jgi:hypothetical protein
MESREIMNKVEIIVEHGLYSRELLRLKRWLVGWLYDKYGAFGKVAESDGYIVIEAEGDMFELFNELRIEMKLMLRDVRANVDAFGVCSGDECVVVDSFIHEVVLNNHVIKRLNRLVNKVMHIVGIEKVGNIEVLNKGGMIVVYMEGCCTRLYPNEAFMVGVDLAKSVENMSGLKVLGDVGFVYDVIEPPEPRSLEVDFLVDEDGVILSVGRCSRFLKIGEALRLAYWLMRLSLNEFELQRTIERGYE